MKNETPFMKDKESRSFLKPITKTMYHLCVEITDQASAVICFWLRS